MICRWLVSAWVVLVLTGCAGPDRSAGMANPAAPSASTLEVLVDLPVVVESVAGQVGTWNWLGQSVTLPAGNRFDTLRFNWYLYGPAAGEPTAFGTLYVLDREYTGLPDGIGPGMPGFVARSQPAPVSRSGATGQGTEYVFDDDVALVGGQTYWFYSESQGAFATTFDRDEYAGGSVYLTGHQTQPFHQGQASGRMVNGVFVPAPPGVTIDANFRLRGIRR